MADALERITNLLALLLETRAPLTAEQIVNELADQYPSSPTSMRAAFERDKAVLRDVGVPLSTVVLSGADAGKTAYRIDRRAYELSGLELEPDEQQALQVAVAATRLSQAEFGLFKLGGAPEAATMVGAHVPELVELPALQSAVADHAPVTFVYRGTSRRLDPYGLLLRNGKWYVVGHDHGVGEQRTYRVDRIEGAVVVGDAGSFVRPSGFRAADAFPADPKEIGEPDRRATVAISAGRAALAELQLGDAAIVERADDGRVIFDVACGNLDAFRAWLFSWGDQAEVLAPEDLRAAIIAWLTDAAIEESA